MSNSGTSNHCIGYSGEPQLLELGKSSLKANNYESSISNMLVQLAKIEENLIKINESRIKLENKNKQN